jgi:glycosyltransferase involved in cell wall biosynthesis
MSGRYLARNDPFGCRSNMMEIFSCNAPYNEGGLGKHLAQLVEIARSAGELGCYYASRTKPNDHQGKEISLQHFRWLFKAPPLKQSLNWRDFLSADLFDRAVARRLKPAETFRGFSGRAKHSFTRGRQLNYQHLTLESPTTHIAHVRAQHRKATLAFPLEKSWLNRTQYRKSLLEYGLADTIYVTSNYSRQTYIDAGVPEAKLRRRVLTIESRFAPPIRDFQSRRFTIVYVGRLQVSKGVPILVEAFARLDQEAELILVGGYGTTEMEKYLNTKVAAHPGIKIRPGDPLPYLHRADVLVHPSFEDGLGLAPLEALACGVPVIVTEDTGMKEYVEPGRNGYILPTGNIDALVDQLRAIRSRPLKGAFIPFSPQPEGERRANQFEGIPVGQY